MATQQRLLQAYPLLRRLHMWYAYEPRARLYAYVALLMWTCVALLVRRRWRRGAVAATHLLPNRKRVHHLRAAETNFLYGEIFRGGGYLAAASPDGGADAAERLTLKPGDTVVDVGANIGMFALFCAWSPETAGNVRVLSYEPVPSTHAVLDRNARLHSGGRTRLEAYDYGLSDAEASATINHHPNFSIWSTTDAGMDGARDEMLRENLAHAADAAMARMPWLLRLVVPAVVVRWAATRLLRSLNATTSVPARFRRLSDAVFREGDVERVSLLKIDVEGAELSVLRGVDAADWPKVDQVAMELESKAHAVEATALLEAAGFEVRAWVNAELVELLPTCQVHQLLAWRAGGERRAARARTPKRATPAKSPVKARAGAKSPKRASRSPAPRRRR